MDQPGMRGDSVVVQEDRLPEFIFKLHTSAYLEHLKSCVDRI